MVGETVDHYHIVGKLEGVDGLLWYDAEDTRLGRHVALKFLPEDLTDDRKAMDKFVREARAASRLNHPGVCTIYDIQDGGGQPFIVMEKLEGITLGARLRAAPLEVEEILDIGIQVADALAACHANRIIHRDIRPNNIFITNNGLIKILGFGLAKVEKETMWDPPADDAWPFAADLAETVMYMSPERLRGEELDARTDLFSLGVVLYEMVTGRNPFASNDPAVMRENILNQKPVSPRNLNPRIPPDLEGILGRALEKERGSRYPNIRALRADLMTLSREIEFRVFHGETHPPKFYSCFISYSTVDQEFADRLYTDLRAEGVQCWFAPHDIKGGRKIHEQLDEAIRLHDKLLLVLSEHSINSEWVQTEIAKARKRESEETKRAAAEAEAQAPGSSRKLKPKQMLFPVTLVPFDPAIRDWECFDGDSGKDFAREIREYFIPDFSNWKDHDAYQKAFNRLVADLKADA